MFWSNFMFSLALVKFSYEKVLKISVKLENVSLYSILLLVLVSSSDFEKSPPSHPLELTACELNSLLVPNKLLLSIVSRAFCVAEWIMAVGNCFYENFLRPMIYWSFYFSFSAVLISDIFFVFQLSLSVFHWTRRNLKGTNVSTAEARRADNKSFSVVNNWDRW